MVDIKALVILIWVCMSLLWCYLLLAYQVAVDQENIYMSTQEIVETVISDVRVVLRSLLVINVSMTISLKMAIVTHAMISVVVMDKHKSVSKVLSVMRY